MVNAALAKHPNVLLKYGFNHRSHYSVIEAKKIIDSGKLGKLLWIRGVYGKAGSLDYHKNWRNYKKISGGGILIDQGIHMIDLMFHLSGQKFNVQHSLVSTLFWDIESEDNVFALLIIFIIYLSLPFLLSLSLYERFVPRLAGKQWTTLNFGLDTMEAHISYYCVLPDG